MTDRIKLSPRQQRFCLLVVEGETQSRAYTLAGYSVKSEKTATENASRLASNAKVRDFIAKLQAKAAVRAEITVESLTQDLVDIRTKAMANLSFGPAVQAVQLIARLNGLLIEKSELTVLHKPSPLPTKVLELSEADWIRQFSPGLHEKRLMKLESLDRRERRKA